MMWLGREGFRLIDIVTETGQRVLRRRQLLDALTLRALLTPAMAISDASVVADVHTQPTDASGTLVGRVLHVGTGRPRMMVVAAQNCSGPRVYVGFVSSYFERVTESFTRLTDETWRGSNSRGNPADVPWMTPLVVR